MSVKIREMNVELLYSHVKGLREFIDMTPLGRCLDKGAIIAGGFPRYLLRSKFVDTSYFTDDPTYGVRHSYGSGDIDLFFQNASAFGEALSIFTSAGFPFEQSRGKMAVNIDLTLTRELSSIVNKPYRSADAVGSSITNKIRIQLIHAVYAEPQKLISNFDFVNSMIGFTKNKVYSAVNREVYENKNILHLNSEVDHGALLPWRIKRYLGRYGYKKLDVESIEVLKDYVIKAICIDDSKDFVDNETLFHGGVQALTENIKHLSKIVPDDLLIMLMDKASFDVRMGAENGSYSFMSETLDVARYELEKRSKDRAAGVVNKIAQE